MYREPYASADGVGGSKQISDEVGQEKRSLNIGGGRRPRHESRGANENVERRRSHHESRGTNENVARLFGRAHAHHADCD